jgi:hypothetical protein
MPPNLTGALPSDYSSPPVRPRLQLARRTRYRVLRVAVALAGERRCSGEA